MFQVLPFLQCPLQVLVKSLSSHIQNPPGPSGSKMRQIQLIMLCGILQCQNLHLQYNINHSFHISHSIQQREKYAFAGRPPSTDFMVFLEQTIILFLYKTYMLDPIAFSLITKRPICTPSNNSKQISFERTSPRQKIV